MEIEIGKKKFIIDKVSLYISDLYACFVRSSNELLTGKADFDAAELECDLELEEAESKADRFRAELKLIKNVRALKKDIDDRTANTLVARNNLLKELVELNGYEWDEALWLKGMSEAQFSCLIDELMGGKKKVDAKASST